MKQSVVICILIAAAGCGQKDSKNGQGDKQAGEGKDNKPEDKGKGIKTSKKGEPKEGKKDENKAEPKESKGEFKDRQLEMALEYLRGQIRTAAKVDLKKAG